MSKYIKGQRAAVFLHDFADKKLKVFYIVVKVVDVSQTIVVNLSAGYSVSSLIINKNIIAFVYKIPYGFIIFLNNSNCNW